tara:strand:- start:739 stop:843 length:105 start_codon:yes stop_codon:yes gene_type:complete
MVLMVLCETAEIPIKKHVKTKSFLSILGRGYFRN